MNDRRPGSAWQTALDRLVLPLLVNLLTAAVLFFAALALRDQVMALFAAEVEDYPLFVAADGYTTAEGNVAVDLFVVNLLAEPLHRGGLEERLELLQANRRTHVDTGIRLSLQEDGVHSGGITAIEPDADFNSQKAAFDIIPPPAAGGEWLIYVERIDEGQIARLEISTDAVPRLPRPARGARDFIPLNIRYPGKSSALPHS